MRYYVRAPALFPDGIPMAHHEQIWWWNNGLRVPADKPFLSTSTPRSSTRGRLFQWRPPFQRSTFFRAPPMLRLNTSRLCCRQHR